MKNSIFTISLDFEMMWGGIDIWSVDDYGKTNIVNVYKVIPRLIELFEKYDVHATFGIVGLLFNKNKSEMLKNLPESIPDYKNLKLSPYTPNILDKINKDNENLYFCPNLIEMLKRSPNIEIGTHTYCHYYCWEDRQTKEQFETDIKKACEVAQKNGIELKSIIFPRNEVNQEYLEICAKYGITSYRGNALNFFGQKKSRIGRIIQRIARLLDAYIPIGGPNSFSIGSIDLNESPLNIRASRFFRPYSKRWSFLELLRIRRIKSEIKYAAKHGEIYHLWWHPHNMGINTENNFKNLENILKCYREYKEKYNMHSCNMNEIYKFKQINNK